MPDNDSNIAAPIGLFDSGLGGLTVLKACKEALSKESYLYLGDTARTPYGSKDRETIQRYSHECGQFLINKGIKLLVVACNTASSYALQSLEDKFECPVIGTITPAVQTALKITTNKRVGIIGTEATINSGSYDKKISELGNEIKIFSQACPLLVSFIEQGIIEGEIVNKVIELYLGKLKEAQIDTLILGCTHYPLLTKAIQNYLGPEVRLINCADAIAKEIRVVLTEKNLLGTREEGFVDYFVTDDVQRFNKFGALFLNEEKVHAKKVGIDSL